MKCIDNILIQKYIDGEASENEISVIENHNTVCEICSQKLIRQRESVRRIKQLLSTDHHPITEVPMFVKPSAKAKKTIIRPRLVLSIAAAASLALFAVILNQKQKDKADWGYSYDIVDEFNANLPVTEQKVDIVFIDSDGKIIQYY